MIEIIRQRLAPLEPSQLDIIDDSHLHIGHAGNTGGGHYRLVIAAPSLVGLSRLAQHQRIYGCLQDLIPTHIHALQIQVI